MSFKTYGKFIHELTKEIDETLHQRMAWCDWYFNEESLVLVVSFDLIYEFGIEEQLCVEQHLDYQMIDAVRDEVVKDFAAYTCVEILYKYKSALDDKKKEQVIPEELHFTKNIFRNKHEYVDFTGDANIQPDETTTYFKFFNEWKDVKRVMCNGKLCSVYRNAYDGWVKLIEEK